MAEKSVTRTDDASASDRKRRNKKLLGWRRWLATAGVATSVATRSVASGRKRRKRRKRVASGRKRKPIQEWQL